MEDCCEYPHPPFVKNYQNSVRGVPKGRPMNDLGEGHRWFFFSSETCCSIFSHGSGCSLLFKQRNAIKVALNAGMNHLKEPCHPHEKCRNLDCVFLSEQSKGKCIHVLAISEETFLFLELR